jgi:hypothetical protein
MTDDLTPLASAYLDGEATVDEVAQIERDAEMLVEVERLRQVRAVVGDVDPMPISVREAHLAAALDTWDRLPATERDGSQLGALAAGVDPIAAAGVSSISAPATSSRARRTSRSNGWVLAAAASLVVLLAGGLTLRSLTGDDGESDTAGEITTVSTPSNGSAAASGADADTTDPSLEPSEAISDPDTGTDESTEGAPPPEDDLEELGNPEQLGVYASDAVGEDGTVITEAVVPPIEDAAPRTSAAPAETTSDFPLCAGADYVVGPATYQGTFVVVGIDTDNNVAIAYLPTNCAVVAQAQLP